MPPFKRCPLAFLQRLQIEYVSVPSAKPQWIQAVKDTALAIEERLHWECRANGKPKPSYAWLKNGQQLLSGVNYSPSSATYQYFILKTKSAASAHLPTPSSTPPALSLFFPRRGLGGGGTNISLQMEVSLSRLYLGRLRGLREWISALAAPLLSVI